MNAEAPDDRIAGRPARTLRKSPRTAARVNQLGQAMGRKGQETRKRLLAATLALLETTKIRDLQVSNIARAARTSSATFYVYFNDVTAAVLALLGEVTQSTPSLLALLARSWADEGDTVCAHAFVGGYVEHWRAHSALFRVRNLASDEGDARFTDLRIHAVSALIEAMGRRVEARQRADRLPSDLDARSLAGALLALVERIAVLRFSPPNYAVTRDSLIDAAAFFVSLALGEAAVVAGGSGEAAGDQQPQAPIPGPPPPPRGAANNLQGQAIGPKGAATRNRIVEATDSLIRARGLREFSVKDIADLAKVSSSTFYLYFADVSDAILSLISRESQYSPRLIEIIEADPRRPELKAEAVEFVDLYVETWQRHAALFRVRNLAADEGDDRFVQVRSDAARPFLAGIAHRVADCQARGVLPADLHPFAAAGAFLAMIERLSATPNVGIDGRVTRKTLNRAAAYFLSVLLAGV
jgi:AcrR family transcriptional regulator